ncbi:MAG: ABC transporter permease [Verrucomicrobiae bacterium]|nr:ABC transporter permease [Verrucomicrobiae bacterium]
MPESMDMAESRGVVALLFRRFTLRHWRRHWRSTALLVGILALGVGVFLSIRLANRAAVSGFDLFTESISGESDFVLRPRAGQVLPESVVTDLRAAIDPLPVVIFPVIEATVAEASGDTTEAAPKQLLGVDLVGLRNLASFGAGDFGDEDGGVGFQLGSPNHGFVADTWARNEKRKPGDSFDLIINDRSTTLTIAGTLKDDPLRPAVPENLVLMDLPGAQTLLGMPGEISRVELVVPPGSMATEFRQRLSERIETLSASDTVLWRLETRNDRRASAAKMTHAFRLNLTVLSTLALLVGTYLILQAMEAAVVRRRSEIAILRSLGVEPGTIRRVWLAESLALGVVGSAIGIGLGWAMAQLAVGGIARTVNGLYYATTTEAAGLDPSETLLAFTFGVLASLLAGWLPARDAASTPPAQALRTGNRVDGFKLLQRPGLGVLVALIAMVCGWLPVWITASGNRWPVGGYLAALGWLIALSILAGVLFVPLSRLLMIWFQRIPEACYAASQLRRPTGRHRLAMAGLIAAIGMASGMGILVHSFEGTLTGWINQLLRADLYVATAGATNATNANVLTPTTWRQFAEDESVEGVDVIRRYSLEFRGRAIKLAGSEYNQQSDRRIRMNWLQSPENSDPQSLTIVESDGAVPAWVNEAFSRRFLIGRGDRIELVTPRGPQAMTVKAVYADYSDEAGTVLVNRNFTAQWFDDETVSNAAIYLKPGMDHEAARARWMEKFPALVIRGNVKLRSEALRVFHQTFAVTYALEAIGVVVAVIGLGLALASLLVERRNEMTTLNSIGFTRAQIARASAIEGSALAAIGLAGGFALSLILGVLLIYVINRQSFGWTLEFRVPWGLLVGLGFLTLATSAAVSAIIGYRGSQLRGEPEE